MLFYDNKDNNYIHQKHKVGVNYALKWNKVRVK